MKLLTFFTAFSFLIITSHVSLAQTNTTYKTNLLVTEGKKSKDVKADISFGEASVKVTANKPDGHAKEFKYTDITGVDYSYSKKPLLSTGGAIATAILIGVFVLPLLFMKKKQHWLTIKGNEDFAVMRLEKENFRQIKSEFEVRKIVVTTINEDSKESKDTKDSKESAK